jgi:hypothetical protein
MWWLSHALLHYRLLNKQLVGQAGRTVTIHATVRERQGKTTRTKSRLPECPRIRCLSR